MIRNTTAYDVNTNLLTCVYNAVSMGKITLLSMGSWAHHPGLV